MTIYSFQFTHYADSVANDYKFIVYHSYSHFACDIIDEFNGQEALTHYKVVEKATTKQQQQYLHHLIAKRNLEKKSKELASQYTKSTMKYITAKARQNKNNL